MGKKANSSAFDRRTLTWNSGATFSNAVDLEGYPAIGLLFPTTWGAANVSFQAATATDGTFRDIYTATGGEVVVTAGASRGVGITGLSADGMASWGVIRGRSGTATAGGAVAATATQNVKLFLKG